MGNRIQILCCCSLLLCLAAETPAQRIRLPQDTVPVTTLNQGSVTTNPLSPVPPTGSGVRGAPSTTLGQPTFDPYGTGPNAASTPPTLLTPGTTAPSTTQFWQQPNYAPSAIPQPAYAPGYAAPTVTTPGTGYPAFPQQPPVLFPNGVAAPNWCWPQSWPQPQQGQYLRLFQEIWLTHSWLYGKDATDELQINDTEVGTTVNFPNFFYSGQPLHVSPVFVLHQWDGPETGAGPPPFPTELPPRAYSAYVNFGWEPVITPQLGGDVDVSVGVFSDFSALDMDSLRIQGTGVFVLGLTPTIALKGGVTYLDRLDLKFLPAGGILWQPNPKTRFDIFFPKPKLAQYLTTIGNTDIWWYLNGEYGGGSWTVERAGVVGDRRMDINDIRVGGGLEWTCVSGVDGFVEVAYVFNRELVFASGPPFEHELKDTFMVRGGLTY